MELDDLKSAWQTLDRRIERQSRLQFQLLRERHLDTVRSRLRRLFWGKIVTILFGDALLYLGIMASIGYRDTPHLLACSLFLLAYGACLIVLGGVALVRIDRVDYSAPVLDIQRRIAHLERKEIVSGICIGLPWWLLWLAIFLLEMKSWAGIDLWLSAPAFVLASIAAGIAGLAISIWAFRRSHTAPQSRVGRWFERRIGAQGLREARRRLEEVRSFEQAD
ncbi:MAG TPA: hypothetical protein PLK29_08310 [Chiayiivirga sp.]|nr:hypothetical protein [Chiayiivirga sp.]